MYCVLLGKHLKQLFFKRKLNGKTVNVSRKDENFIAPDRRRWDNNFRILGLKEVLLLAPMLQLLKSART
jgi:hypothetical protein